MTKEQHQRICQNARYLRNLFGYSQQELAIKMHMGRVQYVLFETGQRPPSLDFIIRLAEFYQVKVDLLVEQNPQIFFRDVTYSSKVNKDIGDIIVCYHNMSSFARGALVERAHALLEIDQLRPTVKDIKSRHSK